MPAAAHWSDPFIGMPWKEGVFDCGSLIELVRRDVFRHEIHLTSDRRSGPFGRNAQVRAEVQSRADRTDTPADGDLVLLICKARLQHIGLYCVIGAEPWVLHNGQGTGVVLRRVRELEKWGFGVEGYYRWT